MAEIIGVRFNSAGKAYYFDPDGQNLSMGTMVVVETSHGVEWERFLSQTVRLVKKI